MAEKTISIRDAANELGCTVKTVHDYINDGKLSSVKVGHAKILDRAQVEKLAEARQIAKRGVVAA